MDSLVLFVGLLVVALSNGFVISPEQELSGNRANRDVSHAGVPGGPGPVPVAPAVDTDSSGSESSDSESSDSESSYDLYDPYGSYESYDDESPFVKKSTTDGVSTTVERSTTEAPSKGTSTESATLKLFTGNEASDSKSFTEDTFTDAMDIVDSTGESFPVFDVGTNGNLYLDGNSQMLSVTFFGYDQNYTVSENVSTEYFTLEMNDYSMNITNYEVKVNQYVISLDFTIASKDFLYDGHLEGIINTWRVWFVQWRWGAGRRKRSTDDTNPKWDSDADIELKELFNKGILKKALEEKQKAGFPSEAPFDAPSIIP